MRTIAIISIILLPIAACTRTQPVEPRAELQTPSTQPAAETAVAPDFGGSDAPRVNLFGELGNSTAGKMRFVGETGFQQHSYTTEGNDSSPQLDPTGKWMVYTSTRHQFAPRIYVQRTDGTTVTQLTNGPGHDAYPTFSPDGNYIAFCSTRNGDWDIYVMDVNGHNVTQVTNGLSQDIHPSFSPDGETLVYCSKSPRSDQWELWTVNLKTRARQMIGFGLFPRWSPDKNVSRIAFQRARKRGSRWFSLWTLDLINGEARRISEVAVSSNAAVITPDWSPDGARLAFATIVDPGKTTEAGSPMGQQDIWVIDADGSNRKRITEGKGVNLSPTWSTDGRLYFISNRSGQECIWSSRVESGKVWVAKKKPDGGMGAHADIQE